MIAADEPRPLVEGPIVYRRFLGEKSSLSTASFERQARRSQHAPLYELTDEDIELTRKLVKHTPKVRRQSDAVDGALWHFGRSCLARLPRDQLFDAVIGLENLLVHGHSSGYQLQLSGTAVMAATGDEAEALAEKLRDIWNSRGKVAHSSERDVDLAKDARRLLARAVFSVMELIRDGELQPAQKNIPEEIQHRILREVPFRAEDGS